VSHRQVKAAPRHPRSQPVCDIHRRDQAIERFAAVFGEEVAKCSAPLARADVPRNRKQRNETLEAAMNFSTLSIQNGEAHARVLANNKRALENLFFLVAAEVTRLRFLLETASRPASQSQQVECAQNQFCLSRRESKKNNKPKLKVK
jgi:hypothetical protein